MSHMGYLYFQIKIKVATTYFLRDIGQNALFQLKDLSLCPGLKRRGHVVFS